MSERPKLAALVSALDSLKWSEVMRMAIHLSECVTVALLADVQESHPNEPKLWIMHAMDEWLQKDDDASWIKVVCALRETKMNTLATEIEKKHCVSMAPHLSESTPLSLCGPQNVHHDQSEVASSIATATADSSRVSLDHSGQDRATCSPVINSDIELNSAKTQEIAEKTARLRTKFTSLLIYTKICFMKKEKESENFLETFQVMLTSLPMFKQHEDKNFLKKEKIRIKKAKDVDEIFDILDPYWDYVDYDFLEHIIKEFGTSDLQKKMKEYVAELEQFEKKTTVHDFSLVTQGKLVIPAHYRELAIKLDKDSEEWTLHDVRKFKNSVANQSSLENYVLFLEGRSPSSVKIIFAFPPEAHANLSEAFKDEQFWRKHEIFLQVFSESVSVRYGYQFIETHPCPTPWLGRKQPMLALMSSKEHHSDYKSLSVKCYVAYKRFVASYANSIEATQIAYTFPFENPSGLIEIVQDVGYEDLGVGVGGAEMPQSLKHAAPNKDLDKPIPKQRKPVPKQRKPIPKQRKPVPKQRKPVPKQRQPVPMQRQPVPMQRQTVPMQHKPVPMQRELPIPKQRKIKLPLAYEQAESTRYASTLQDAPPSTRNEAHDYNQPRKDTVFVCGKFVFFSFNPPMQHLSHLNAPLRCVVLRCKWD